MEVSPQQTIMSNSNTDEKLVTTVLDDLARDYPQRTFAEFLQPPHLDQSVLFVTLAEFANAVDRLALWLKEKMEEMALNSFDMVTYIGLPDIRYYLMPFAASKAQIVVFTLFLI